MPDIVLDGLIFQNQKHGGISRIYQEVLPRISAFHPEFQITIATSRNLKQPLPQGKTISRRKLFPIDWVTRPANVWWPITAHLRNRVYGWQLRDKNQGIWQSTFYTTAAGWKGPTVVTVYDMVLEVFSSLFSGGWNDHLRARKQQAILAADAIICISETTRQDLIGRYGISPMKASVAHLACSPIFRKMEESELSSPCELIPTQKPFLLYLGGRDGYKNFRSFVAAYSMWSRKHEVDILVTGVPWTSSERRYLSAKGLESQIHNLGFVPDEFLCRLYNRALAFVYPSLYEGFGIPLLEAMSCGCPIIASDIPSTREIAWDVPIYFDAEQLDSFVEALDCLFDDSMLQHRIQQGRIRAERFSWDITASIFSDVYQSLCNE